MRELTCQTLRDKQRTGQIPFQVPAQVSDLPLTPDWVRNVNTDKQEPGLTPDHSLAPEP